MAIDRGFFMRDTLEAARELIGCSLVSRVDGVTSGIIVEAEAYLGARDPAAHSYRGATERVRALYGPKGHAYIYLIYGLHWCLNISSGPEGEPECILLRALEPKTGLDIMAGRRNTPDIKRLSSGPGKLCAALGVTGGLYGCDMCCSDSPLFIEKPSERPRVLCSERIGIDYAGEAAKYLWRFTAEGSGFLSR